MRFGTRVGVVVAIVFLAMFEKLWGSVERSNAESGPRARNRAGDPIA